MRRCAFLTMANPEGFFVYDELAYEPMAERGWQVDAVPWTKPNVNWDDYELVVVRSTWDYQNDAERFLQVLATIDASTARLENRLDIMHWNIDKVYLKELETKGVPIVPTRWLHGFDSHQVAELRTEFGTDQLVVKPLIGANADDTFRIGPADDPTSNLQLAIDTFRGRDLMAQPFIPSVQSLGEYSLFYFGGVYSHSVLKTPAVDDFRVQEEHGSSLKSVKPDERLLRAGEIAMQAIDGDLLYARADFVLVNDQPALMEIELIEPSLYFTFDPESPRRFAEAVERLA